MAKKHLVIVESPAKAKTIGKYLGKDYEVKASMGHLRDLPKSTLGVDVDEEIVRRSQVPDLAWKNPVLHMEDGSVTEW